MPIRSIEACWKSPIQSRWETDGMREKRTRSSPVIRAATPTTLPAPSCSRSHGGARGVLPTTPEWMAVTPALSPFPRTGDRDRWAVSSQCDGSAVMRAATRWAGPGSCRTKPPSFHWGVFLLHACRWFVAMLHPPMIIPRTEGLPRRHGAAQRCASAARTRPSLANM